MKRIFILSVLTSVAMICACQKKDSAAKEQLTQPKTEPGGREEALGEKTEFIRGKSESVGSKSGGTGRKRNSHDERPHESCRRSGPDF